MNDYGDFLNLMSGDCYTCLIYPSFTIAVHTLNYNLTRTTTRRSSSTGFYGSPKNWTMPSSLLNRTPDTSGKRNQAVRIPVQHPPPQHQPKLPRRPRWKGSNPPSHGSEQPSKRTSPLPLATQVSSPPPSRQRRRHPNRSP